MKEKWNELIGKRILLRKKHLTTTSITEATVVEVSESGKFVNFKWRHGGESWEIPNDEYDSFHYDKILEVLGPTPEEIEAERKSEEEKAYTQNMRERAQVASEKEKKEQIEINCYRDEMGNWRYNCDKLKFSGGYTPLKFAEELDNKYGSKADRALPAWLESKLKIMKAQRLAISPKADNYISGYSAAIREIEAASRGYAFPRM